MQGPKRSTRFGPGGKRSKGKAKARELIGVSEKKSVQGGANSSGLAK